MVSIPSPGLYTWIHRVWILSPLNQLAGPSQLLTGTLRFCNKRLCRFPTTRGDGQLRLKLFDPGMSHGYTNEWAELPFKKHNKQVEFQEFICSETLLHHIPVSYCCGQLWGKVTDIPCCGKGKSMKIIYLPTSGVLVFVPWEGSQGSLYSEPKQCSSLKKYHTFAMFDPHPTMGNLMTPGSWSWP